MPTTPRQSSDKNASLAAAELLAQRSGRARQRVEHFTTAFLAHCQNKADDEPFLMILLDAALSPDAHPALAGQGCLEAIARAALSLGARSPSIDPAPYLAKIAPLASPPEPPSQTRLDSVGRGALSPLSEPWECLARAGWSKSVAQALAAAKAPWAPEFAPLALANGASPDAALEAAKAAGWSASSARALDALSRCVFARDRQRLDVALSLRTPLLFGAPPHPMAPSPLEALFGNGESERNLARNARSRMGLASAESPALEPCFDSGVLAILESPEWGSLPHESQRAWAQRFFDGAFSAGEGETGLSPNVLTALKKLGASGASAWGTQRALERALGNLHHAFGQAKALAQRDAQCAKLVERATQMLPLIRAAEPNEPPIVPLCVRLIEFLGADRPSAPATERAIHKAMDQWAKTSFGPRALSWMEGRSGATHSAPNAICSLPRTKARDFSEPAARWLGAFLAQGFDAQAKATPKSKSLQERAAASKSLAPLYAQAEAVALGLSSRSASSPSATPKARL